MDSTRAVAHTHRFTAGPDDAGERIDRWLTRLLPEQSRARVQALIREGHVRGLGAVRLEAASKVRPGLVVEVTIPEPAPVRIEPEDIPLTVVYEDADLIVVNKPPGLVVHPAPGHPGGTLVNALLHHCRDLAGIGSELRPGIVHRLDRDTSGVMVVAKTEAAMQSLGRQFRRRTVVKRYAAVVHGCPQPPRGTIDAPIGRSRTDRKRMSTRVRQGREALTAYRVVAVVGPCSLVRLRIATGRTHQIRVHLAHAGYPVVGDAQYGRPAQDRALRAAPARQMLHAESLALDHPVTGRRMRFLAPWPADFRDLLHALRTRAIAVAGALTAVLAAASAAPAAADPRAALDAVFAHRDFDRSPWACAVVDAGAGVPVYERRADEAVIPASNQKLFVAAAAWLTQGPDARSCTEYWARGPVAGGVLEGSLVVRGYGAFCLTARFPRSRDIRERDRALREQLDGVAARLRAAGVRQVRGQVGFDRSRWTDMGPNPRYRAADALLIHDNTLDVAVTNGTVLTCPSRVLAFRIEPSGGDPHGQRRVLADGRPTDAICVDPASPGEDYWRMEASDPCEYYAGHIRAALVERGIPVAGAIGADAAGPERLLFRLPGLSLRELLPGMLTHSDNLRAEMVLLNLGYSRFGRATYANGTRACEESLTVRGLAGPAYRAADGCGLSLDNRVTCRDTVRLLAAMAARPDGADFRDALAVSGVSGTLEKRLAMPGLKGRVRGKTGSLGSVTALSGYARTDRGRTLCFSMICNRVRDPERCWRAIEDALTLLVGDKAVPP